MIPVLKCVRPNLSSWHDSSFVYPSSGRIVHDRGMYGFAYGVGSPGYVPQYTGAYDRKKQACKWLTLTTHRINPGSGKCLFWDATVVAVHDTLEAAALDMMERTDDWQMPGAAFAVADAQSRWDARELLWVQDIARAAIATPEPEPEPVERGIPAHVAQHAEAERLRRKAERQAERAYWRGYVLVPRPAPDAILVDWPMPNTGVAVANGGVVSGGKPMVALLHKTPPRQR